MAIDRVTRVRLWLSDFGYTGERRAVALLPLCLFGLLYFVLSLNAQPGWGPALLGLALAYLIGFFALASGWFWARWFASGLGWSGFMVGVMAIVMFGWHPSLGIFAGLHGLIVAVLLGPKMAARYEQRPAWRARYGMDDFGVARLGKAVTRGAGALPTLILWALAPRESATWLATNGALEGFAVAIALGFLIVGLSGLVRLRGFAVLALAGAVIAAVSGLVFSATGWGPDLLMADSPASWSGARTLVPTPALTTLFLMGALLPLIRPVHRFLTQPC